MSSGELTMSVPSCATLSDVSITFGQELRRRRELARLSRKRLEALSGVSESNISLLETRGTTPGRTTVIDLAQCLQWPIDEALALAGQPPLRNDERAMLNLPAPTSPRSARRELLRLIDELSDARVESLLHVAMSMQDPEYKMIGTVYYTEELEAPVALPDQRDNQGDNDNGDEASLSPS